MVASTACALAQSAGDADAIVRRLSLQTSLPDTSQPARARFQFHLDASVFELLIYTLTAAILGFLGVLIYREARRRGLFAQDRAGDRSGSDSTDRPDGVADVAVDLDGRIARLVAELRAMPDLDAATHRMLIEVIAIIRPTLDFHLSDSFTSREVLERLNLGSSREPDMAVIVDHVERSHFGGRAISRTDFERCLGAFLSLVAPQGRPAHG